MYSLASMQRRRRQASLSFAPLPRQLDLSKQLLQQPKREFEVGEDLQIRQQTTTVANEAELREVYERLFQPYETEVPREATTRTARALGNPTVTRPPRVTSGGSEAAHEVLRAAVNECVATSEWLELLVIARQARRWYDAWRVNPETAHKPWWMLQATSGADIAEQVDLTETARRTTDLTEDANEPQPLLKRIKADPDGLPEGWSRQDFSHRNSRPAAQPLPPPYRPRGAFVYYHHAPSGKVQWERPEAGDEEIDEEEWTGEVVDKEEWDKRASEVPVLCSDWRAYSDFEVLTFARPGTIYDAVLELNNGETAPIKGRLETKGAFRMEIKCPLPGPRCWLGRGSWEIPRVPVPCPPSHYDKSGGALAVLPVDGGTMLFGQTDADSLKKSYVALNFDRPGLMLDDNSEEPPAQEDDIAFYYYTSSIDECKGTFVVGMVLFRPRKATEGDDGYASADEDNDDDYVADRVPDDLPDGWYQHEREEVAFAPPPAPASWDRNDPRNFVYYYHAPSGKKQLERPGDDSDECGSSDGEEECEVEEWDERDSDGESISEGIVLRHDWEAYSDFDVRNFARAGVVYDAICSETPGSGVLIYDSGRGGTLETKGSFRLEMNCWLGEGTWEIQRKRVRYERSKGAWERRFEHESYHVLPVDGGKMLPDRTDVADLEEDRYELLTFIAPGDRRVYPIGHELKCRGGDGESVTVTVQKEDIIFYYQVDLWGAVLFRPRRATGDNG